ncbi:MAG: hypothetical protein JRH20_25105 [Deltaproteobacteria bacterium]|nr:hypothetical protein [Deltaproteobacteria bacterium]
MNFRGCGAKLGLGALALGVALIIPLGCDDTQWHEAPHEASVESGVDMGLKIDAGDARGDVARVADVASVADVARVDTKTDVGLDDAGPTVDLRGLDLRGLDLTQNSDVKAATDSAPWSPDDRLARETVRALNAVKESRCQLIGVMKNDEHGTYYYGRLRLKSGPPARCQIIAEAGACFIRHCEDLTVLDLPIAPELDAGVGFTTNQSRWSSNPYWSSGSANTFYMPPRGGDITIGWRYDGAKETTLAPAPSIVSAVAPRGEVRLDRDLIIDLTYQRTAAEELATPSTIKVQLSGGNADTIECLVPDTVDEVRVDARLLRATELEPADTLRIQAGGYLYRFADVGSCKAWVVIVKYEPGHKNHASATTQIVP